MIAINSSHGFYYSQNTHTMKIGVLTHLSPSYPLLVSDFLSSLKLALGEKVPIEKVLLSADASEKKVEEETQKLLMDDIDCLIVYTNVVKLELLQDMVAKMGKTAIFLDSGAQPRENNKVKGQEYWLSLQLMESAYHLGKTISSKGGEKVAVLSDFINSGYQMTSCFVKSIVENEGEVLLQYVAPQVNELEGQLDQLANRLIEEEVTLVYINAHGEEGELFLSISQREDIRQKLPNLKWCIGSQLFNEVDFSKLHEKEKIYSCSTWNKTTDKANSFVEAFEQKTGRKPSMLSFLAYEAATIVDKMKNAQVTGFESLRGNLVLNDKQKYFQAQQQVYLVDKNGQTLIPSKEHALPENKEDEIMGGWKNAYLCY